MNRRGFLKILGIGVGATAGVALAGNFGLDPEMLLWVPGTKTFFLPPQHTVAAFTVSDIDALKACFGGWFHVRGADGAVVPGAFQVDSALKMLSDEDMAACIHRGRKILERPVVLTAADPLKTVIVEVGGSTVCNKYGGIHHVRTRRC